MEEATKKESYQQVLIDRCEKWWKKYEDSTSGERLVKFDWPKILYDFVKQVALESFKNGVTVGKRKSDGNGRQQGHPHRAPGREA